VDRWTGQVRVARVLAELLEQHFDLLGQRGDPSVLFCEPCILLRDPCVSHRQLGFQLGDALLRVQRRT
jgi:hypothetical protein